MILRATLFAPVELGDLVVKRAHADADVVLPDFARLAADPGLPRVLVLRCGSADAAYEFNWLLRLLLLLGLLGLSVLAALRRGDGLEFVKGLGVLTLGRPDRASWLGFTFGG